MTRLYTFTISHFAEKARWSLDYKGIHYQEKRLVPGSHVPIIKRIAPSTFVPVLEDAAEEITPLVRQFLDRTRRGSG